MLKKNKLIVFVGPDGSGKTTVINKLISMLPSRKKTLINHIRFNKIPRLGHLKKILISIFKLKIPDQYKVTKSTLDNPKNLYVYGPSFPVWKIILVLSYEVLDYLLGYFDVYDSRDEKVIIFDRYIYDYYTEKDWCNTPKFFMKFLMKIIPKPDYIFFMKNEPEVIHKRKKELVVEDIRIVNTRTKTLLEYENNFIRIDTNNTPEQITENIIRLIS
tara:strand:- start:648 stop:1295 length:648 start_codon:yes stop_codon:yes gene_type:complete